MPRTVDSFNRLLAAHRALARAAGSGLFPPLSDEGLARLRSIVPVPDELAELLTLHDGQEDRTVGLPMWSRLLSADEIAKLYADALVTATEYAAKYDEYYGFIGNDAQFEPLVKYDRYWRAGWVPFAQFQGNIWFIDNDPGPEGIEGQIVYSEPGIDPPIGVLANHMSGLFERLLVELEAGRSQDDGFGGRVVSIGALTPSELQTMIDKK